ncbi:unnamed protein product [Durusdinium trenchii]|uniref:BTB domain-containing protein n=1 Tax=Durusdinium trenchii TaxID=1381693 RepID=A0ABP0R8S6_9DINO
MDQQPVNLIIDPPYLCWHMRTKPKAVHRFTVSSLCLRTSYQLPRLVQLICPTYSCQLIGRKPRNELLNSNWSDELDYLDKALERIARPVGLPAEDGTEGLAAWPWAEQNDGILENWERCLRATCSHDLTLDTADGPVTAHAVILKEASPVIKAMLGSPMKEQETQHVQVKDSPKAGVSLFLETLYTCSTSTEPDYHTVLSALDLAHRWQVHVVVAILTDLLGTMITEESFPPIAEHAATRRKQGRCLVRRCQVNRFWGALWSIESLQIESV